MMNSNSNPKLTNLACIAAFAIFLLGSYILFSSPQGVTIAPIPTPTPCPEEPIKPLTSNFGTLQLWHPLPLMKLRSDNYLAFPPEIKTVWVDVGVHKLTSFMATLEKRPDLFVIGFEAQPELALNHPKHPRLAILPCALSNTEGYITFNLWSSEGASIMPHVGVFAERVQPENKQNKVRVPVVLLDSILSLIPPEINLEYAKIDAQGADFFVLQGAKKILPRIRAVSAECQDLDSPSNPMLYYSEACLVSSLTKFMADYGFRHYECWMQNPELQEKNCHFGRTKADLEFAKESFS